MGRRTTYLNVVQDEQPFISGAWAAHPKIKKEVADQILFGADGSSKEASEPHSLALARYDFTTDSLSAPKPMLPLEEGGSPPRKIAVQPKGEGVIISFETGCKLFTWEEPEGRTKRKDVELKLQPSEEGLGELEAAGPQSCITFSDDGTLLASAGEDGHVRVFNWPSMEVVISAPKAMKSVKDLDISLDAGFLSATGDNCPGQIWDLKTGEVVGTLELERGERFGPARFSRNLKKAFLFVTINKDRKGFVGVWDMTNWKRIGAKKFLEESIAALAIPSHGKRLAIGTRGGDIYIVETEKMIVAQTIRSAHSETVTSLQFSPNNKALLSLSSDLSSRVTALDLSKDWKEWQISLVFLSIFVASILVFYGLYAFGDPFFKIPEGRKQYDKMLYEQHQQQRGQSFGFKDMFKKEEL
ncbi:unnamed protein product [Calypogeia fissa]